MVNLLTTNTITTATYFQVFKSFTPAATGDYYFGFHSFSDANQFNLYVDDIRINYSTECGPPTGVSVTTNTASSGSASWSAIGNRYSKQLSICNYQQHHAAGNWCHGNQYPNCFLFRIAARYAILFSCKVIVYFRFVQHLDNLSIYHTLRCSECALYREF